MITPLLEKGEDQQNRSTLIILETKKIQVIFAPQIYSPFRINNYIVMKLHLFFKI